MSRRCWGSASRLRMHSMRRIPRHRSSRHQASKYFRDQARAGKLLDFGLAKLAQSTEHTVTTPEGPMTSPGSTIGTVAYMSPEQVRAEELDPRTDLFAFGSVMYEMATGDMAFSGSSNGVVFESILNRMPPPASEMNPAVPEKLNDLISEVAGERARDALPDGGGVARRFEADQARAGKFARKAGGSASGSASAWD